MTYVNADRRRSAGASAGLRRPEDIDDAVNGIRTLIVADLEATCSEDGTVPRQEMETIEIGAQAVALPDMAAGATFHAMVRPVRHPKLTTFCRDLTGIDQEEVTDAPPFPAVFRSFRDWIAALAQPVLFASWGDYDRHQLQRDCRHHGLAYDLPRHLNLKEAFSLRQGTSRRYGMAGALHRCNLGVEGRHHRALDDALNIARLLPWILGNARLPS